MMTNGPQHRPHSERKNKRQASGGGRIMGGGNRLKDLSFKKTTFVNHQMSKTKTQSVETGFRLKHYKLGLREIVL